MASACSPLSEEQFLCSICLEVFNQPVTVTCGHNFCKTCITQHWDGEKLYQCPMCKELFNTRPELRVNTLLSDMTAQFRKSVVVKDSSDPEQKPSQQPEVLCDYCTETKLKAVKSCLGCMASYCEEHMEPHLRIAGLKRHQLIDPVENLEDRMCKKHNRILEMFCQTEEVCVCQFCSESDHKLHLVVPLKVGYEGKKAQLGQTEAEVQQMIQERQLKIQQIQRSVKLSKEDADRQIAEGVKVFIDLITSIKSSQAEFTSIILDKHKSTERQAKGFIEELEQELMELTKWSSELEMLSHTEDHLHLLQNLPSRIAPPHTKEWTKVNVHQPSYVGTVRRALDQIERALNIGMKRLCDAELKKVQKDAVDVTLDPDTAHPYLVLSENGKQAGLYDGEVKKNLPDNPERFSNCACVLGNQSFSSGRFYYEVDVKGKKEWDLGVARESINRKEEITLSPKNGFWAIWLSENEYDALDNPVVILSVREKLQKVGVYVDYEEGLVSFYDVDNRVHIYSFTKCIFTESLYPYFSPCNTVDYVPLIITPVNKSD